MHEPIQKIKDLDPQDPNIGLLALARLKLHERLAQQRRGAQARLRETHGIAQERLRLEQLVEKREDDAVEYVLDLPMVVVI